MQIRVVDIEEYFDQIARLWVICFPEDDLEYVNYYIKHRLVENKAYCFACFDDTNIVSMINVIHQQTYCNNLSVTIPSGFIVGVCTHPNYRRKGLSAELMRYLCAFYCENKIVSILQLSTQIPKFYEKLGFTRYSEYCPCRYLDKYSGRDTLILHAKDISQEIARDLLLCYIKNAKDGFFKKDEKNIIQMAFLYDEVRVCVTNDGNYDMWMFYDKTYENETTYQMVKYLTVSIPLEQNTENY